MDALSLSAAVAAQVQHTVFRCSDSGKAMRVVMGKTAFDVGYTGSVTRDQTAVESIMRSLCATTDGASASLTATTQMDAIGQLVADSAGLHEGIPHGVPSSYTWYMKAVPSSPLPPVGWTGAVPWGQIYVDESTATTATNTRVEIGDIEMQILSTVDNEWHVSRWTSKDGALYPEDYVGASITGDIRAEGGDGVGVISVTAGSGRCHHFFPSTRLLVDRASVGGVAITIWARLIVANSGVADDRTTARYLLGAGGDWWSDSTTGTSNTDMGVARLRYVTTSWRPFRFTTLSGAALRANPPIATVFP
jgi:hypothetical protein